MPKKDRYTKEELKLSEFKYQILTKLWILGRALVLVLVWVGLT